MLAVAFSHAPAVAGTSDAEGDIIKTAFINVPMGTIQEGCVCALPLGYSRRSAEGSAKGSAKRIMFDSRELEWRGHALGGHPPHPLKI